MSAAPPRTPLADSTRTLNWRNGGLGMALLVLMLAVFVATQVQRLLHGEADKLYDVRPVKSYDFDLTTCLVPRDALLGTLYGKGQQPALDHPRTLAVGDAGLERPLEGTYKLVSDDRVVGVEIAGAARAYPLWVLAAHEVCNDVLGGRAIAVAHNPLCDSVVVFDRTVGDTPLELAPSGLIYNSAALLYDRRDGRDESLWCPIELRAVAGPAAANGRWLEPLPATVTSWSALRAAHPSGDVALPEPGQHRTYRPNAYLYYLSDDRLRYPVSPSPPAGLALKTPIVALRDGDRWRCLLASTAPAADVRDTADAPRIFAFWFAWYAAHPDTPIPGAGAP